MFLLNSELSFLTCSQMQIYIHNLIVTNFHCYCVRSVAWPLHLQGITLFAWLLRYIVCFAGQNRRMPEANRSKCSPYIYQQCYCFLYGCLNSYSGFKGIFTPSKFISYYKFIFYILTKYPILLALFSSTFYCLTPSNFSKLGENMKNFVFQMVREYEFYVLNHASLALPFSVFLYLFG